MLIKRRSCGFSCLLRQLNRASAALTRRVYIAAAASWAADWLAGYANIDNSRGVHVVCALAARGVRK
jgi:hypothetical protein